MVLSVRTLTTAELRQFYISRRDAKDAKEFLSLRSLRLCVKKNF